MKEERDVAGRVGTWRAVRLIVALGWSRICNRTVASISSAFGRGKRRNKGRVEQENSGAAAAVRLQGSPRRNRVGPAVGVILSCLVIFGITVQVSLFLSRMYRAVEERDGTAKAEVDAGSNLFAWLKEAEAEMRSLAVQESLAGADAKLLREIGQRRTELVNRVRLLLTAEASDRPEGARFDPNIATRRFLAGGADALRGSEAKLEFTDPLPRRQAVFFGNRRGEILVVLGAALTLLVASALTMSLGVGNQDLGKVGWGTEWLFGFPVPATSVMVAKIGEYALFNFFGWIAFPLLTLVFVAAGFGWWSGLPGFVFAVYLNALVGSGRVLVEAGLRRWLGVAGRKNAQAFFALLGSVLFFGFYALMASPELAGWFVRMAAQTGRDLPWWNPVSLPLHACAGGGTAALVGFACLGVGAVVVAGSAWICGLMVSGGLTGSGGARAGRRFQKGKGGGRCAGPRSAGGKEFLLLVRDRSVMVQVLVTPVLVLGFWLSLNLDVATGILQGFQHAATAAFVAAVYVLSYACLPSLKREGGGLWMLFSFPRSPSSILAGKARFWGFVGCLYAVPVLAWGFWNRGAETTASDVAVAAMVIAGIFLYAFIATAMGALATDPLAPRTNVPVDAKTAYLFMMLVALFVYGIYAPSAWTRLVQLVLCALLGYALWQRLRDALPYFFEPLESPPKRISLSHGLVATYSFFVFQGIGALVIFSKVPGLSPGASLLVSYVVAGLIVFVASVFILWRMEGGESVFRFPHVVKLGRAGGILTYTVWVCGAAAVSVGVGLVYLKLSESVPGLQMLKEASIPSEGIRDLGDEFRWWFAGMAVIAAPLCEEFIFRGLVYRGLRRTAGMPMATLGSAALFALVHPPFSVFPVYVLGVVTAVAFENTGRLIAPVMIHMAYNAAMISAQMGLW